MVSLGESSFLCLHQRFLEAGQELEDAEKEDKIWAADHLWKTESVGARR